MREALIEILRRLHKTPWDEIIENPAGEGDKLVWGKPLWLEEDFIHELQDLIEEPIFEESETIAEGMEKLRELYGSSTRERPPYDRGNPALFRKGIGWLDTENDQ